MIHSWNGGSRTKYSSCHIKLDTIEYSEDLQDITCLICLQKDYKYSLKYLPEFIPYLEKQITWATEQRKIEDFNINMKDLLK